MSHISAPGAVIVAGRTRSRSRSRPRPSIDRS